MTKLVQGLMALTTEELHQVIVNPHPVELHGDIEQACNARIAAIPRLPLGPDGRWWHYSQASSYPFGH